MKHNFWRVLALAVLATALLFFLAGRFNVISTALGTILLLLLLTERPEWEAPTIDRCAWAAVFGLILLLAVGPACSSRSGRACRSVWPRAAGQLAAALRAGLVGEPPGRATARARRPGELQSAKALQAWLALSPDLSERQAGSSVYLPPPM